MSKPKVRNYEIDPSNGNGRRYNAVSPKDFGQIYDENYVMLLGTALRILQNKGDAEDATQNAFVKFFEHSHEFRGDSKLSTYLTRIVINESLMKLRKEKKMRKLSLEEPESQDNLMLKIQGSFDDLPHYANGTIEKMLYHISSKKREALILCDFLGCKYSEVAKTLNCSKGNVRSNLYRARKKLIEFGSGKTIEGQNTNRTFDLYSETERLQRKFLHAHNN